MPANDLEAQEPNPLWLEFEEAKTAARRKRDLIRELLLDLESELPSDRGFEIESYLADRTEVARQHIDQLRAELETRLHLHAESTREIDTQIGYCQVSLEKFAGWGVGYNTGVDMKRSNLERQLQQLRSERRRTEVQAWDDVVRLRKELRDARREYRGAQRISGAAKPGSPGQVIT